MGLFIVGMIMFFGIHLVPCLVGTRQKLIGKLGGTGYKAAFSVISVIGFVVMLYGWTSLPHESIFIPPAFGPLFAKFIMLPACILMVAAYIPCRIRRRVGHPMIIAVFLWALVHILANGDYKSLLLFGAFLLYSVADWVCVVRRQSNKPDAEPSHHDWIVVAVGCAVYFGIYYLHEQFIAPIG